MSDYTRRPFLMGNTDAPFLSQPEMRGSVAKDSSNEIAALPLPSELALETEDGATSGGISVTFTTGRTLSYIISRINTVMSGYTTAEEFEGTLTIKSVGTGEGSYIRVVPPVSGFANAATSLGLETHPHPLATVEAGDLQDAPVRPEQQDNPVGTKMVATGEDRVGSAYNRILQRFGINQDTIYTWLQKPVAVMAQIEVDSTTHAAQVVTNGDGTIDQIDLSDLSVFDSALSGKRLFVGGGAGATSPLTDIAEFWGVLDTNHNELTSGDRTVRIGAVTRGQRGATRPSFADDFSNPSPALGNTTGTAPDGLNALGVDRTKSTGAITEIRERTTAVCSGATFETDGVEAGDKAVISGASVNTPFNHNGTYLVETVVDEETLILRPWHGTGDVRELNPASGTFGTLTISSGGEWEQDIWVTFSPSLPRFPEDGKIILLVPVEVPLGEISVGDLASGDIRSAEEVDGWVKKELWKEKGLDGVYQGQGNQLGSGFWGRITNRPLTMASLRTGELDPQGTLGRASSASASMDYTTRRLTAAAADRFNEADIGKTILLTDASNLPAAEHPWTIIKLIDAATVELAPPPGWTGYDVGSAGTVTSWEIRDGDFYEIPAMMRMIAPDVFGIAATQEDAASQGVIYFREHRDTSTDAGVSGQMSFAHLEKLKLRNNSGSPVNMVSVTSPSLSADTIELPFDPEDTRNILPEFSADNWTAEFRGGVTFVRVLHGANQGVYRVYQTMSSAVSGTDAVVVRNLDGSMPTFSAESNVEVSFYNAYMTVGSLMSGGPGSGTDSQTANLSLFGDSRDSDVNFSALIRMGWRGDGVGLLGVVGDPEFHAYDESDGPTGKVTDFRIYSPVQGITLSALGASSGADDRRSTYGFKFEVASNLHDLDVSGLSSGLYNYSSFSGLVYQGGKDPGTLVVKSDGGTASAPTTLYSKLTPGSALLVGRAGVDVSSPTLWSTAPAGRGSAVEQRGSTWIYRGEITETDNGQVGWADGGLYVEDVVATGKWAYPMAGVYSRYADVPWQGAGDFSEWEDGTTLGYPGRVWPRRATISSYPTGDLLETDYSIFNVPHMGILRISDNDPEGETIPRPFNRLVGCRVRVIEGGHSWESEDLVIQAVKRDTTDSSTCYLALYYDGASAVVPADVQAIEYVILGQRYHQAYLNVGDYFLVGTGLRTAQGLAGLDANLSNDAALPLTTALPGEPNSLNLGRPASRSASLEGMGLISDLYWTSATEGVRLGLMTDLTSMTNVRVTSASFASAVSWVGEAHDGAHVEHGWSEDVRSPRSPFPNHAVFARPDPSDSDDDILDESYLGNLVVDDYAITLPGSPGSPDVIFRWAEEYGGCLYLTDTSLGVDQDVRIWQRGHTMALEGHLAVRVRMILQWSSAYGDGTVALRTVDGTAISSQTITLSSSHPGSGIPVEFEFEFLIEDDSTLHEGAPGSVAGTLPLQQLCVTLDVTMPGSGSTDFRILEWQTEPLTRPQVTSGPQVVAGTVAAHGFRLLDPVPGYDSRGPQDVWWLSNEDYGTNFSHDQDPFLHDSGYTLSFAAGMQEKHHRPGRIRLSTGSWYVPFVDTFRWWGQGLHSASITMWTGAFDPVFYIHRSHSEELPTGGTATDTLHLEQFVTPGMTGFGVPFDPPHGSMLRSLALSLSFLPSILDDANPGNKHWGVFNGYFSGVATGAASGDPTVTTMLERTWWDTAQGVRVHIWRQSILDTGIDHGEFAEFNSYLPEHGYTEKIATFRINLSGFDVDSGYDYNSNLIDSAAVGGNTYYAGRELFVRRNFNLWEQVGSGDEQLLQVDRRNYTYFATIEWWGGPRAAGPFGSSSASIYYYDISSGGSYGDFPSEVLSRPTFGSALNRTGYEVADNYVSASNFNRPPRVKFRGARLGYLTDRGGHGGWGS